MKRSVLFLSVLSLFFVTTVFSEQNGWWPQPPANQPQFQPQGWWNPYSPPVGQLQAPVMPTLPNTNMQQVPFQMPAPVTTPPAHQNKQITMSGNKPVQILKGFDNLSRESATCMSCHREKSPGIYDQWGHSKHFLISHNLQLS